MMMEELPRSNIVTLSDYIRSEQRRFSEASGTFTNVLLSIALGTKILSRGVNRAGLAAMLGLAGGQNVQGEQVQKLDVYADKVFRNVLGRSGEFISMVSEEQEHIIPAKEGDRRSKYVIAFDPLDGSSNIDVNVSIGSIWGIYRRLSTGDTIDPRDAQDFLQPGTKLVAAGYTIYGSSTMFVFSSGNGVQGFTLDPTIGEFILTNPDMQMPTTGSIYSCNEANYDRWSPGIQSFLDTIKREARETGAKISHRYVGSLVADFHRTLLKGGIFFYPADSKNANGKLRLLYECAPMAYIAEQAGGKASTGRMPILDVIPESIHQRVPFLIGSSEMVHKLETSIAVHDASLT